MFITGHAASALLAARRWTLDPRIAVAATLFPDVVDKPAKLLGLTPTGRMPSHTLLALGLITAIVLIVDRRFRRGGRWAAAWAIGYSAHLLFDMADVVPLLWPFRPYPPPSYPLTGTRGPVTPLVVLTGALDMTFTVTAIVVELRRWRARRASARAA